ncbi:hypothetical protein ACFQPA_02850 [Halomarina halobia]|uniref:DUF7344 domain-containing protein n=1 Tax=Halomarina halobia TaxID=3033386 RepID=A0ABD6A417_9EURY|nr:hypothetical protein [Halomarina sp. PSR21]
MATRSHTAELPGDVVDDLLAAPRRRRLLGLLYRRDEPTALATLAAHIAAAEAGVPVEDVRPEDRRAVWWALHEEDLPKLLATDVVAYDSTRDALSLSRAAAQFEGRLAGLAADDR